MELKDKLKANESGSLVLAMTIVFVILLLLGALVFSLSSQENYTLNTEFYSSAQQQANAAISDAAFQLDQFGRTNLDKLPTSFCFTNLDPAPPDVR